VPFSNRTGTNDFSINWVSPSPALIMAFLNEIHADDSSATANANPNCTASAPSEKAASIDFPETMPPAAITGIDTVWQMAGTKQNVVVSSFPLWPPASKPSATTAFTPQSYAFFANLLLDITCTTVIPSLCKMDIKVAGLPADVKAIFTLSSIITRIIYSVCE